MPGLNFEFSTSNRILFGSGSFQQAGSLAAVYGKRVLVILGVQNPTADRLVGMLIENGLSTTPFSVLHEPDVKVVSQALVLAAQKGCDAVIGFGGGSAMDTAKAVAALLANPGDILDYLEVIGKGQPLLNPSLPCIAIPTTAGTGAEVTRNAVLSSSQHGVKVSLRSPHMLPRLAIVDPELTLDLPPSVTASTGLDALTQILEPYVSNAANPLTDALCREGMLRAARSLRTAYQQGGYLPAREDMCIASLFGGLALANAKLGAVHGFAGVIGGMFPIPHGVICARLLPLVISANVQALKRRLPDGSALQRFDDIAQLLTGESTARAADGVAWIKSLTLDLAVPGFSTYGMTLADIAGVADKSAKASSMKGNPIVLTQDELTGILEKAL